MLELLDGTDRAADAATLVELGLHHEQQHQELLLMDIKHVLSCNPLLPAYGDLPVGPARLAGPTPGWLGARRRHRRDRPRRATGFAFDNEGPRHDVLLRPFAHRRGRW